MSAFGTTSNDVQLMSAFADKADIVADLNGAGSRGEANAGQSYSARRQSPRPSRSDFASLQKERAKYVSKRGADHYAYEYAMHKHRALVQNSVRGVL